MLFLTFDPRYKEFYLLKKTELQSMSCKNMVKYKNAMSPIFLSHLKTNPWVCGEEKVNILWFIYFYEQMIY